MHTNEEKWCKNAYLGSIFIPEKYLFRVCFESPFYEDDIQPEIQVPPGLFQKVVFQKNSFRKVIISKFAILY